MTQTISRWLAASPGRGARLAGAVRRCGAPVLVALVVLAAPLPAGAGGTPTPGTATSVGSTLPDQLLHQAGESRSLANGDWVSDDDAGALNTYYEYFIEVPPGQASLQIDVYDADIGVSADLHDGLNGGGWNTTVSYEIREPDGSLEDTDTNGAANCAGVGGGAGCDNAWVNIFTVANPQSGHWSLRVSTTAGGPNGDDHHNYGIRAHDGNSGVGGTEYNVYAQSYVGMGESSPSYTTNRNYHFFPYVYRGCTVDFNDFDADNAGGNAVGAYDLTTRSGNALLTGYSTLSTNNAWNNNAVTGWTSDFAASDYGLWRYAFRGAVAQGGVNNVYTVYVGADNSPNPSPTTQPVAAAARIYFPRDGSSYANGAGTINVPVKPWVGHSWLKVAGQPPIQVGVTTRIEVTVTVTNPGAFPILFSAAAGAGNRVIATVPTNAGQTTYVAGSIAASQGAVSATGAGPWTMNWGPGSVAAGATATLTYRIDVTPTSAGAKLLTGTPAASGTTATFVDHTCAGAGCTGSRLTTATFSFGPMCELRATVLNATAALVSRFGARVAGGAVVVEWETAAEAGTVGFELYRQEAGGAWKQVGGRPLTALLTEPQGGFYRLVDPAASPRARQTYLLVEREASGAAIEHGPYTVEPSWEAGASAPADGYRRTPRRQAGTGPATGFRPADKLVGGPGTGRGAAPAPAATVDGIRIGIEEDGIYRVDAAEIATLLGRSPSTIEGLIRGQGLRLTRAGEDVTWWDDGAGIGFYAEGTDSPFARENAYFLTVGRGRTLQRPRGALPAPAPPGLSFGADLDFERDTRVVVLLPLDPEGDTWFWDFVRAGTGDARRTFTLAAPGVAPDAGPAELKVRLQGGSAAEHTVAVEVGGVPVGSVPLSQLSALEATFELPPGLLAAGDNQVAVTATAGGIVFIDGFSLAYDRLYRADGGSLLLRGEGHTAVTVEALGDDARVLHVGDPLNPRLVPWAVASDAGGTKVTFVPAGPDDLYLAYDRSAVGTPSTLAADYASDLLAPSTVAEYVVIAPAELLAAAAPLADHRAGQGLGVLVVDLQDVYDEMNGGVADPAAIRGFLAAARQSWSVRPRWVVLAGAGTYDYRDILGFGGNLIPPKLVASDLTAPSLFATDAWFADLEGDDGVPEVAVGRIPVTTPAQLSAFVDKLIAYETAPEHPGDDRVIVASDQPDAGGEFPVDAARLAELLPGGYTAPSVSLPDFPNTAAARQALFAELGTGAGVLAYLGHGGVDRLAGEGLLTNTDVAGLANGDRLPIVSAVTCHIGLAALPGFDALGEILVREPDGGAIAVVAPAWLSTQARARDLGEALVRGLTAGGGRVGDAVVEAMTAAGGLGAGRTVLYTYQLFGDPATVPRVAPAPGTGGGPPPAPEDS